jgi:hypothetical protein
MRNHSSRLAGPSATLQLPRHLPRRERGLRLLALRFATTSFTIPPSPLILGPLVVSPSLPSSLAPFFTLAARRRAARPPAQAPPVSLCFACCLPATGQLGGARAEAGRGEAACAPARARWERRVRRPPPPPISRPQDRLLNLCRLQIRNEGVEKDHRAKFHLCPLRFCHHDHPLLPHPSGPSTGCQIHFEIPGPG